MGVVTRLDRAEAARQINPHLAPGQTAYLVAAVVGFTSSVVAPFAGRQGVAVYLDAGSEVAVTDPAGAALLGRFGRYETLVVAPDEAISAAEMNEAFRQRFTGDDRRLLFVGPPGPRRWPRLLVDALAVTDPGGAEQLRAAGVVGAVA